MHGVIPCGLRRHLVDAYGERTWEAVLAGADVPEQLFVPVTEYPDGYHDALLEAAAARTGRDPRAIERDVGRALVEHRLGDACCPLDDDPTGLHRLARVDEWVDGWFAAEGTGPAPLSLSVERVSERSVRLTDDAPDGLCAVVRGIVDGLGALAAVRWSVTEQRCVHDGAPDCSYVVEAAEHPARAGADGRSGTPEPTD